MLILYVFVLKAPVLLKEQKPTTPTSMFQIQILKKTVDEESLMSVFFLKG